MPNEKDWATRRRNQYLEMVFLYWQAIEEKSAMKVMTG